MALIKGIGRSGKVVYGTNATFEFRVNFPPVAESSIQGLEYIKGQAVSSYVTPFPVTTGTITIAGTTVTLTSTDILSPIGVVNKILATSVVGFTSYAKKDVIVLTSTTVGPITKPTVALGTALGVLFTDYAFVQGVNDPRLGTVSVFDDIAVFGRTPINVNLAFTGGTVVLQSAYGTEYDQQNGTLVYSNVTLSGGQATITTPISYLRVNETAISTTQITLNITR